MESEEDIINNAINSYNESNYESSLENYNKIIELNPDSKEAYYNKGIVLQKMNNYKESLEAFSKSLEFDSDFIPSLLGKALSLFSLNPNENVLEIYDKIISLDEKNCDAYINKSTVLLELGKFNEAIDCINKIENIIKNDEIENKNELINKINFIKGNIEHQRGDINKAIELYNLILEKDNNDEQVLTNKGICLLEQNNLEEANKCFDIVLKNIKLKYKL